MVDIVRKTEAASKVAVYICGTLLIMTSFLVCFEVIARKLLHYSLQGTDELTGYAMAFTIAWGSGYALFSRSHIRVDVVYVLLSKRLRAVLDVIALFVFGAVIVVLCRYSVQLLLESWEYGSKSLTPMRTPLVIPQSIWFGGMMFFLICIIVLFLKTAQSLIAGDIATVRRLAGAKSISEEVEEETRQVLSKSQHGQSEGTAS